MSGAGTGYHPRSPTPGDLSGAVEADRDPASVSAHVHPVGLAEKLEVDSFIQLIDPEEYITAFTVTDNPEHEELEMESQEIINKTIDISNDILKAADQHLHKILSQVVAESIVYNVPGDGDDSEPTQKTVEGRAKMAVCESFIEQAMAKMPELFSQQHDQVFEQYYVPQLKKGLSAYEEKSKQKCLMQIHKVEKDLAEQLASYAHRVSKQDHEMSHMAEQLESAVLAAEKSKAVSNDDAEPSPKISASQIVYEACLKDVQVEYAAWCAVKMQYDAEMTAVAQCSDSLHFDSSDAKKDKKIKDFTEKRERAKSLKSIMEFKFESIIETIYRHYPDIAGSASSATHKKGYAMHDYKLPDGILGSKHDAKIASEMIAGMLQISQAWIEDFFLLVIVLKRIQDNESPFAPVYSLTIAEFKVMLGADLGEELEKQMGKMWSVVSRGNQDIVEFNRNNPSVSMFAQITTGGNGEPERKSTVEPKNIISFVCYCVHHHDQGLSDRRRQMTAVMKNAYALLSDGCIVKACEKLQKHWAEAMSLKVKVDWYSLLHLGSDILRHRSTDFWDKMTQWINNPEKDKYTDDCLPKISAWIADILAIASRLTNSSPRKYVTHEITAAHASLQAYSEVLGGKAPGQAKALHVDTSAKSNWKCGNKECQEKIPKAVVDGHIKRREKHGKSASAPVPQYLLCSDCHDKHSKGNDITLSDGSTKRHFQQKEDAASEEARKAKNKEKNARKKARKAAAKKEAKEADEAEQAAESEDAKKGVGSDDTIAILRKMNAAMESLPSKLAAMAVAKVAKADAADVDEGVQGESKSAGVDEPATSVLKQMLGAYERSGAQAVEDSPKKVTFEVNAAAGKLYAPN